MSEPTPESTPASPRLAPIRLHPSRWLQRLYPLLLISLALLPWLAFMGHAEVPMLWLIALCLFDALLLWEWWLMRRRWRAIPRWLGFEAGQWYLRWDTEALGVVPMGEWLVWPWLQVVRFRVSESSVVHTLVVLPDSATVDDRRRLRVWLRMGRWHEQRPAAERR